MRVGADVGEEIDRPAPSCQPDCEVERAAADMLGGCPSAPIDDVDQRLADDQCPHPVDGTGAASAACAYTVERWTATTG